MCPAVPRNANKGLPRSLDLRRAAPAPAAPPLLPRGAARDTSAPPGMLRLRSNPLVLTDAYNLSHSALKVNADWETSHVYNRKAGQVLFGFHEAVCTLLDTTVDEAKSVAAGFGLSFPTALWTRVVDELGGRIPLRVEAVEEGSWTPAGTPFAQVSNTVVGFGELVTWFEAPLLHAHFSSACATEAKAMRDYLEGLMAERGYPASFLQRFHSFGFRGHRSLEDAYWAGSAWALFLSGSDDLHIGLHHPEAGLRSIPALAHKVVQQFDSEMACYTHAVEYAATTDAKVVAIVIDTYDAQRFVREGVVPVAQRAQQLGVHVVFRPDSGDLWKQVVDIYDKARAWVEGHGRGSGPERVTRIQKLMEHISPTSFEDIAHLFDPQVVQHKLSNVSAIVGEGMSLTEARKADAFFSKNNVPLPFVSYGIGAGFYKHIERDTLGWAMKTAFSNGAPRMKFSENPMKRSTPGVVDLYRDADGATVVGLQSEVPVEQRLFHTLFCSPGAGASPPPPWAEVVARARAPPQPQVFVRSSGAIKDLIRGFKERFLLSGLR